MRWAGHVERIGEKRNAYRIFGWKAGMKETTRRLDLRGRIILKWILERWDGVIWTGLMWLRIETTGELL
jgi:hypothetical protein